MVDIKCKDCGKWFPVAYAIGDDWRELGQADLDYLSDGFRCELCDIAHGELECAACGMAEMRGAYPEYTY